MIPVAQLPGFRRRFRITPGPGRVVSALEDDYHCMKVVIEHDGLAALAVEADMERAPWTTCPGAAAQLKATFSGVGLDDFASRSSEKRQNCTHLHDLAVLGAAHARDEAPLIYDVLVSDPSGGERRAELKRNGEVVFDWAEQDSRLRKPVELEGLGLLELGPWIDSLDAPHREAARILRWGAIMAHGRSIPLAEQSDATRMPPSCYTFQPERALRARRVGRVRDFSKSGPPPLDAP